MSATLNDRVCVVTGAAHSIGLAIARRYAELGAPVALLDRDPRVERAAETLRGAGNPALGLVVDVTDRDAVHAAFDRVRRELGPVYALVNNAGVVDQRPFEEITPDQMDLVFRVNVHGTLYCIQAAAADMKARQAGKVINFSSKSGKTGSALMAHYSAAKGAVISLTHAIAFELAPFGVNVNCLCPGIVEDTGVWSAVSSQYTENLGLSRDDVVERFTAKIPLKRLARVDDVVAFVEFLTVGGGYCTGQAFNLSGGREMH